METRRERLRAQTDAKMMLRAEAYARRGTVSSRSRTSAAGSGAHHPGLARLGHGGAGRRVFAELVAQRADRDAEDLGRVRAVAEAVVERVEDEVLLDLRDGASDECAGDGLRGPRRTGRWIGGGGPERLAFRRADGVDVDLRAGREQHRPVHRVLELADVAAPGAAGHE